MVPKSVIPHLLLMGGKLCGTCPRMPGLGSGKGV